MKVLSVVGARPQFVKLAPVAEAMSGVGIEHLIVHTGQHYDANMSEVFFSDLQIPTPDVNLGIGSGAQGVQTGAMLAALDGVLDEHRPDWVLVYGDTNSTLAGALSAVKMHIPVAHLEAGLRSFNRRMPEEHNRVLTDHAADLLLAPTLSAMGHLDREGLADRALLVGDVMADVCLRVSAGVANQPIAIAGDEFSDGTYFVATLHRAENTDDSMRLRELVGALQSLDTQVLLLVHPRLAARAQQIGVDLRAGALTPFSPVDYPTMVRLIMGARKVLTDSGGLQKEAYMLGTPCVTLRTETEWVETVHGGWNVVCPHAGAVVDGVAVEVSEDREAFFGSGQAARAVAGALLKQARRTC